MEKKILRLYQYLPLVEECHDKESESKEWHRRLQTTLMQTFWLGSMSNLNDPFERNFKIVSDPDMILNNEELLQQYIAFIKQENIDITPEQFKQNLASLEFRKTLVSTNQRLVNSLFSGHGIACFTNDATNLLMWAHYANKHRGFCTIVDLDFSSMCNMAGISPNETDSYYAEVLLGKEVISFNYDDDVCLVFTKVKYSPTPPIMRFDELWPLRNDPYSITKYLTHNAVAVKYDQWKYEGEFRIVANINSIDSGGKSFNLPSFIKIAGIIMGSSVTEVEKQIFHQLCREAKTSLYQARCSETEYKILVDPAMDYSLSACA